jgi:alpha-glucosidase (family GH31 glycosyl hydrolase)
MSKGLFWVMAFAAFCRSGAEVVGNVRVTPISPTLVRIEQKGPRGFEDRATFTVVARGVSGETARVSHRNGAAILTYPEYTVVIPNEGASLDGASVLQDNRTLYTFHAGQFPPSSFLPAPGNEIDAYVIADHPRIVPPPWGATPPPANNTIFPETSGWDVSNDAPDIYVFVPGAGGYDALRKDYLALTGPVPMLPLWAYGYWDSRYHPYTQREALQSIDAYRSRGFPIDGFVVDTDWRVNGSDGYKVETRDFPDMAGFIRDAHAKNVHLMLNDHPSPVGPALSPQELNFRGSGLSSLLNMGVDVWWYDRNWSTHLGEPVPGIHPEVWGERLYHDMTLAAKPNVRPMIMSNIQGIDSGIRDYAPDPAGHRYPMMWTGDTSSQFDYLQYGVENGVDMGLLALNPYVNEDLGGHIGNPTPELYTRYLEYGAFSPVMRVHCTLSADRHPWVYGPEAEDIVRDYIKLRYRLLPTFYAAARRASEDGVPILRRCDLEWPHYVEAADNHQFLLGDDLLVAPVIESANTTSDFVPSRLLKAPSGDAGLLGEYFLGTELKGSPTFSRIDPQVRFNWDSKSPRSGFPREQFSVRWTGKLGPMPETGEYILATKSDDGARLFLDGKLILNRWVNQASTEVDVPIRLKKGSWHDIRMEYFQGGGGADAALRWRLPSERALAATRRIWIPPGFWTDLWTGQPIHGPTILSRQPSLRETPMFAREGGMLILGPQVDFAQQRPWDDLTVEIFLPNEDGLTVKRTLYEDDGISNGYLQGAYRKTTLTLTRTGNTVRLRIAPPGEGMWARPQSPGGVSQRAWTVRLHMPRGEEVSGAASVDGRVPLMPLMGTGPGLGVDQVYQVRFPKAPVDAGVSATFVVREHGSKTYEALDRG